MRKTVLATLVAAALTLGGCATLGGIDTSLNTIAASIAAAVKLGCGLQPTIQSILNLIGKFTKISSADLIRQVADEVCHAAPPPVASFVGSGIPNGSVTFRVRGVRVTATRGY